MKIVFLRCHFSLTWSIDTLKPERKHNRSRHFLVEIDNIVLKLICKNKVRWIILYYYKTHSKAIVIKTMGQNSLETDQHRHSQLEFWQRCKWNWIEKDYHLSTNGAGTTGW